MSPETSVASDALHKFLLIYRHLRQTARSVDEQGIRGRQLAVLQFIQEHGPATVSEIQGLSLHQRQHRFDADHAS